MSLDHWLERLYDLKVDAVGRGTDRHERPHKPLLLLAMLDLLDEGASPEQIPWSQPLRQRYRARFEVVQRLNDRRSPELPFLHLRSDGFWRPEQTDDSGLVRPLDHVPRVRELGRVHARLDPDLAALLASPHNRALVRSALVARYFPQHAEQLLARAPGAQPAGEGTTEAAPIEDAQVAEELAAYSARGGAFRRKILALYDHQCAACGLRLRVGEPPLTLVDAAHLLPFATSHNDHPSNGLALCKNHHWAMDRALIAPSPDLTWRVSPVLVPHRSSGERDLTELHGRPVLPPRDEAYRPLAEGLEYRVESLLAAS